MYDFDMQVYAAAIIIKHSLYTLHFKLCLQNMTSNLNLWDSTSKFVSTSNCKINQNSSAYLNFDLKFLFKDQLESQFEA